MDFTGLHINILARHTLNKNPSYAIAPAHRTLASPSPFPSRPRRLPSTPPSPRTQRPGRWCTARRPGHSASMRPVAPTPPAPHDPATAPPSDAATPRCCRSTSPCPRRFTLLFNVVQKAWRVSSILQADLKVAFDLSAVFASDFIKLLPQNSFFYLIDN